MTQASRNPYPNSDSNKRYYTYDYYLRHTIGAKCAKLPLDIGLTCPNIDGRCATGGCIYCSGRGSGDFAPEATLSVSEQIQKQKENYAHKWDTAKCIAYFQAHTNTYAPLSFLKEKFEEALLQDGIVGINIATRADCLEDDVVEYLASLAERTTLTVELGLQTSNDESAARINRGHNFETFCQGFAKLRAASPKIGICVHIILGLPKEDDSTMMQTVRDVAKLHPDQVKIHLLHVLKHTRLAKLFESGAYTPLEREHYINLVADAIELLPPDVVVARLTGDGMADDLLAPLWSRKKTTVINDIDKLLFARDSWQGKKYKTE